VCGVCSSSLRSAEAGKASSSFPSFFSCPGDETPLFFPVAAVRQSLLPPFYGPAPVSLLFLCLEEAPRLLPCNSGPPFLFLPYVTTRAGVSLSFFSPLPGHFPPSGCWLCPLSDQSNGCERAAFLVSASSSCGGGFRSGRPPPLRIECGFFPYRAGPAFSPRTTQFPCGRSGPTLLSTFRVWLLGGLSF